MEKPASARSQSREAQDQVVNRGWRGGRLCTGDGVLPGTRAQMGESILPWTLDDTRKPLFSNYRCPRAPVTHPPAPTPTLNQSTKIQGNFYFVFIKKSVFFFFMLLVLFFFFSTLFHSIHSGWSRWVPGIKKMPTEVAVSRPGARPTVNTPQKGEKKTQNQPTK